MSEGSTRPAITMIEVFAHRRMCTAKAKRFATSFDADLYIQKRKFKKMRSYPCPFCSGYHMTSKKVLSKESKNE